MASHANVLTVRKIGVTVGDARAALGAARYSLNPADAPASFDRPSADGGRPNVVWAGSAGALAALGVAWGEEVEEGDLALALQGRHAKSGGQVRRPGASSERLLDADGAPVIDEEGNAVRVTELRVNSVDLTFSVPKSVSVVWAQADPDLKLAIEQATLTAANATLDYMVRTKPVVGGEAFGCGFAASLALHATARTAKGERVPSPQLHVHALLLGAEDEKGRLRTPDTAALFQHGAPLEGGALGRAVLAEELRRLGFGIAWGTGRRGRFFEIEGVPEGLIEAFSGRTREVEEAIALKESRGGERLSTRDRAAMAVKTRTGKGEVSPEETAAGWEAVCQEYEFGSRQVEMLRGVAEPVRELHELRAQAREEILRRVWERGPTVSIGDARSAAYEVAPMGLTREEARELLGELQRSGELIALDEWRVTSREIRSLERRVMATATAAARRPARPLSAWAYERGVALVEKSMPKGASLDPEQLDAIGTLTGGVDWTMLTGWAGTGKGKVLGAVAEAHRADGWNVIACAVDNATARRLGHQVGAQAVSIDKMIARVERGALTIDDRTLILIDEGSKVGARHWGRIAGLVDEVGARVCAVGHAGQLGAIELPGLFEAMLESETIPVTELTNIRRHRDRWMVDCQIALDRFRAEDAISLLKEHDAISLLDTRSQAMNALVDWWDERRRAHRDPGDVVLVVHGSNEDVDAVNERAQKRRIDAGDLVGESVQAVDRDYRIHPGDLVMVRESAYTPAASGLYDVSAEPVENGTIGLVVSVDGVRDQVTVRFREPGGDREVVIDQQALREQHRAMSHRPPAQQEPVAALRLAYAYHPFPVQGATAIDVGVLDGHWSVNKEAAYTANTRAAERLHVFVDRESLGVDGTDADRWERLARRWTRSQERRASIRFNESGLPIALDPPGAALSPCPRLAEVPHARTDARSAQRLAALDRDLSDLPDPLERYRGALGDRRLAEIERMALELADAMADLDDDALRIEEARTTSALEALDRDDARLALRIERDHRIVHARVSETLEEARRLEALARATRGLRRGERRELMKAAKVQREHAEQDQDDLGRLVETERQLRRQGRYLLDDWVAAHGHDAAVWVAAQREQSLRGRSAERPSATAHAHAREPVPGGSRRSAARF